MDLPDGGEGWHKLRRFPSSHHSSPITVYPQTLAHDVLVNQEKKYKGIPIVKKYIELVEHAKVFIGQDMRITTDATRLITHLFRLTHQTYVQNSNLNPESSTLKIAYLCTLDLMRQEAKALECHHPALLSTFTTPISRLEQRGGLLHDLSVVSALRKCMVEIRNSIQVKNAYQDRELLCVKKLGAEWWYDDEAIGVRVESDLKLLILINYDQLIMLLDTVTARFIVKLTCTMSNRVGRDILPSWETVSAIYKWGDQLIWKYGMSAYSVIGEFESFVTAALICFSDNDVLNLSNDYVSGVYESMLEIEREYHIPLNESNSITKILTGIKSLNHLSEIFGLRKHWGNPPVDANESGKSVQEKLADNFDVNPYSQLKLLASFNRMIVIEFIKRHGEWPKCAFHESVKNSPLSVAHANFNTRLPEAAPGHDHVHWAYLEFQKNCEVPEFEDDLAMLTDKSVSLLPEHLDFTYEKHLRKVKGGDPKEQRRLILEYLREEKMSVSEIFQTVMRCKVPNEWLANSAAMKGTEMKYKKARIFAVLSYEMRQYFAATEEIIKTCIFPYNPYQTMTMDESSLLARLRSVTTQMDPTGDSKYLAVLHIIDFSKWNLRMKYANTCSIFKSIDNFIGMRSLIESSHDLFFRMINIVQDRYNPPPEGVMNSESDTIWRFHTRGWEGQRQKGWTVLTSALLSDLERLTGVESIICGQGDNQTLLSKFPVPQQYRNPSEWIRFDKHGVREKIDAYYALLATECNNVGLKIKTSESCRSLCYFNYGKRLYFSGVELSMTLKRLAKMATEPNDSFPTSESLLKAVMASEYAANLYSHTSLIPIMVGQMLIIMTLCDQLLVNPLLGTQVRSILASHSLQMDSKFFRILISIPSSLGGIAIPTISSSLVRGHPDPTAVEFALITMMARAGDITAKKLHHIINTGQWYNSRRKGEQHKDKSQLIRSPYSLNIKLPKSATLPISNEVLPALKIYCKNPKVKELFSNTLTTDDKTILSFLSGSHPFHPIVANDIYSRSIPGRRRMFVSGLSNTTSLSRLILDRDEDPIIQRVARCEEEQLEWWCQIVEDVLKTIVDPDLPIMSHHVLLQSAREVSWGTEIVGVTVPHPIEQFKMIRCEGNLCNPQCALTCAERIEVVYVDRAEIRLLGSDSSAVQLQRVRAHDPYTGNSISEGVIQKDLVCMSDSAAFFDSMRLNVVRRWITLENTLLDQFLINLIKTRTNTPLEVLNRASGVPSRLSHNHRAALMATQKTCLSSSTTNIATRMYLSSNKMGKFSHGDVNYALPFGPAFLILQELLSYLKIYRVPGHIAVSRENYHFHVWKDDVPIVYDGMISHQQSAPDLHIPARTLPLFAVFDKLKFQDSAHLHRMFEIGGHVHVTTTIAKYAYATQLFGSNMMDEIVFREGLSLQIRSQYTKREQLISIGDIRMIGLKNLFHALALHFLLVIPSLAFTLPKSSNAGSVISTFLDTFSDAFWKQLCSPLSNPRMVNQVLRMESTAVHPRATVNQRNLTVTIKKILSRNLVELLAEIRRSMIRNLPTPWLLFAPTKSALVHLYARWVEGHLLLLAGEQPLKLHEIKQVARDFSHNIHSVDATQFLLLVLIIRRDFQDVINRHLEGSSVVLPDPFIVKLSEAWVEKIRSNNPISLNEFSTTVMDDPLSVECRLDMIKYDPPQLFWVNISGGPNMIRVPSQVCTCQSSVHVLMIHDECFFMTSGLLSKIHFRYLDTIVSCQLPIESVICLGSRTGAEGAAISRFEENKRVYVNCCIPLNDFSDHAAATYTPPAFLVEGILSKLLYSGEAAVCVNDLMNPESLDIIYMHTREHKWSGITCETTLGSSSLLEDRYTLMLHSCRIAQMALTDHGWLLVNVYVNCIHEITKLVSLMGHFFSSVQVGPSSFSASESSYMMILGTHPILFAQTPPKYESLLSLETNQKLTDMVHSFSSLRWPLMCYLPISSRRARVNLGTLGVLSVSSAIEQYLRGWEITVPFTKANHTQIVESLDIYKQDLLHLIRQVVYSANKAYLGENMPRTSILTIDISHVTGQLTDLYYKIHRANLLRVLLSYPSFSFYRAEKIVHQYVFTTPIFHISGREFHVDIDIRHFFNYFSRFLYELLGSYFGHEFQTEEFCDRVKDIHLYGLGADPDLVLEGFPEVNMSPILCPVWNKWRWLKRSEILTILQCATFSDACRISVSLPHPYLLEELESAGLQGLEVVPLDVSDPFKIYWFGMNQEDAIKTVVTPCWLILDVRDYPEVDREFEIESTHRCPWSGVSPSYVSVYLLGRRKRLDNQVIAEYPNLVDVFKHIYMYGAELVNCRCVDCFAEVILCRIYNLSSGWLDKVCSSKRKESILDCKHLD